MHNRVFGGGRVRTRTRDGCPDAQGPELQPKDFLTSDHPVTKVLPGTIPGVPTIK